MKSMSILNVAGIFRASLAALLLGIVGQAQAYINGWEGSCDADAPGRIVRSRPSARSS